MTALIYYLVDDYLERRAQFREEHLGLATAAKQRGELVLGGAFTDPPDMALLIWNAPAATVEAFVNSDPYVANGLVLGWEIRDWNEVVAGIGQGG